MERKLIIVKCVKGSKTFTEGQTYKGSIVCETEFLTQYKLEGDNGRNYIVNAERFERVHEVDSKAILSKVKETKKRIQERKANNATKSRKAEIKSKLSERGLKLGCYDPTVEKLSAKEFGKVLEAVLYGENGETVLKLNGRLMVATVEVVDGEVDFQINSKENYIFVRGQYAWEDLLEWEGIAE